MKLSTKIPPQATDVERYLLGSMLIDREALAIAVSILSPSDFYKADHRRIFKAIYDLFSESQEVDEIIVAEAMRESGSLASAGGVTYLSGLTADVGTPKNAENYARILREKTMLREAIDIGHELVQRGFDNDDPFDVLGDASARISDVRLSRRRSAYWDDFADDELEEIGRWESGKQTSFESFGLYSLDELVGGAPVGELTTIASHTGAGKTSLLTHIVLSYARRTPHLTKKYPAVVFSAEMRNVDLFRRAYANEVKLDIGRLRFSSKAPKADYQRARDGVQKTRKYRIRVDDTSAPTLQHIRAELRRQEIEEGGLGPVWVDYDEKVATEGATEELRVAAIAEGLKGIAKDFNIPVIALSQYSRQSSSPGWPKNSWLRYSGKKEQESALILHWYWPHYWTTEGYDEGQIPGYHSENLGYLIVSKNRHGRKGKTTARFYPAESRFEDPRDPAPYDPDERLPF